jgi:hypothetical protein
MKNPSPLEGRTGARKDYGAEGFNLGNHKNGPNQLPFGLYFKTRFSAPRLLHHRRRGSGSSMKWPWIVVWVFVALVIAGFVGVPLVHLIGWR